MRGAKRAVQLCCTSDLQRRSAPKVGESNVHVICEQALSRAPRRNKRCHGRSPKRQSHNDKKITLNNNHSHQE